MNIQESLAKREKIQAEATTAAVRMLQLTGKAGLVVGTGVGKSKIAIDVIKTLLELETHPDPTRQILILVPSERLRDNDWLDQMLKFGFDSNVVTLECYQTAYKWSDKHFWGVIADEIDFSLTLEYSAFYRNNSKHFLLGMTGFVSIEKRDLMQQVAPVCFEFSTQDAQREGILNPTKFYEIRFPLQLRNTIKVKYKKNGQSREFYQSENTAYAYYDEKYEASLMAFRASEAVINTNTLLQTSADDAEAFLKYSEEIQRAQKASEKAFGMMKVFAGKRKTLLHTLESSRKVTKGLITKIHEQPGNKILMFSVLTNQADSICEHTFHSKNKNDDKLSLLNEGVIRTLGVCQAINRGVNLSEVNWIIKESYVGSETDFQQQHGRGVRLRPDQTMFFVVLVPYYWKRVDNPDGRGYEWVQKPTQAARWAENMVASFKYKPEVITMAHDAVHDKYTFPNYVDFCNRS